MMNNKGFDFKGIYECGWNLFIRNGFSTDPAHIQVHYAYLDWLAESGINWLVVFWTNGDTFQKAWEEAAHFARSKGINLAKGMYAYSGGGPEHLMAEPNAPASLLATSPKGINTAICPHGDAGINWVHSQLADRLQPGMSGIFIEPARMISRQCICPQCKSLSSYEWDVLVLNDIADEIRKLNKDIEIFPYIYMPSDKQEMQRMPQAYKELKHVHHKFAWGADDEATLLNWLEADSRFEVYSKLGRVQLFPDGAIPTAAAKERAQTIFDWCRIAAEKGRKHYLFDYRVFGGPEWQGHWDEQPCTRLGDKVPASLKLIGSAMNDPYKKTDEQRVLVETLRLSSDWDLDDPKYFYFG
jgi:hypothetical protein